LVDASGKCGREASFDNRKLAIPSRFEPPTHRVEIRFVFGNIEDLGAPRTIRVSSTVQKPQLEALGRALSGLSVVK
jgi:hypothetical protein